jgi:hypothetical protein
MKIEYEPIGFVRSPYKNLKEIPNQPHYAKDITGQVEIFPEYELLCAGVDPNEMRFKRAACFDVGLECGGWGRIVMEIRV